MTRVKKWSEKGLRKAVASSVSKRQVLKKLGLVEAGGNYEQVGKYIEVYSIDCTHFLGKGSNKGRLLTRRYVYSLEEISIKNSTFQSHKLKNRLFKEKIKNKVCELCGWAKVSDDGRIPLELDHINGDRHDSRI